MAKIKINAEREINKVADFIVKNCWFNRGFLNDKGGIKIYAADKYVSMENAGLEINRTSAGTINISQKNYTGEPFTIENVLELLLEIKTVFVAEMKKPRPDLIEIKQSEIKSLQNDIKKIKELGNAK